jgi:hypothetical protein
MFSLARRDRADFAFYLHDILCTFSHLHCSTMLIP